MSASASLPSAHPWRRMMGICYEGVVLFGVLWIADYAFSALTQFRGEPGGLRTAFQLFQFLVLGAYFGYFWSNGRRSLPMKTLSLRLLDRHGAPPGLARALLRYVTAVGMLLLTLAATQVWLPLALAAAVLPFAWTLVDPQRRALYDVVAGTRLAQTGEN